MHISSEMIPKVENDDDGSADIFEKDFQVCPNC